MDKNNIRPATEDDLGKILDLCRQHAEFEQFVLELSVETESQRRNKIASMLFGPVPIMFCLVAERNETIVGYATYLVQYSTWHAKPYLYLDCLFLEEPSRGEGLGKAMMGHVAKEASRLECHHIEWQTPTFNTDAVEFYRSLGAEYKTKQRFVWQTGSMQSSVEAKPLILDPPDSLNEPYCSHPTHFSGLHECLGWQLKCYEITLQGDRIAQEVHDAAIQFVRERAIWPTDVANRMGFIMIHVGEQANWLLACFWVNDLLRQFLFCSPLADPLKFESSPMPGYNTCVWELEVINHEREAWVRHVMTNPKHPNLEGYLKDTLTIS